MSNDEKRGVGMLKSWNFARFKPGDKVECRIVNKEHNGYGVIVLDGNLPAFLPTGNSYMINQIFEAQFVCVHENRMLLSTRFMFTDEPPEQGSGVPKTPLPSSDDTTIELEHPTADELDVG